MRIARLLLWFGVATIACAQTTPDTPPQGSEEALRSFLVNAVDTQTGVTVHLFRSSRTLVDTGGKTAGYGGLEFYFTPLCSLSTKGPLGTGVEVVSESGKKFRRFSFDMLNEYEALRVNLAAKLTETLMARRVKGESDIVVSPSAVSQISLHHYQVSANMIGFSDLDFAVPVSPVKRFSSILPAYSMFWYPRRK